MARRTQNKTGERRRSGVGTSPPGQTVDPLRELIEAEEFLKRMQTTLPEQITGADLETLNTGLRFFFSKLRRASALFHQGDSRHGAIIALAAAWQLVALFKQPVAEPLFWPIFLHLQDALRKLDEGTVAPMLIKSVRGPGRTSSTDARAALRGRAAATVTQLTEAGISRAEACAQVAEALVRLGVRPERGSGQITETTVRHWCDEVAADVGRHGPAAIVYDGMFTDDERRVFSGLQSDQARQGHALNSLAGFVRTHFPSSQSGGFPDPQEPS